MKPNKKINEIEMTTPKNLAEKQFFSYVMQKVKELNYGTIELRLTVKERKIINIKNVTEESITLKFN